MLIKNLKGQVVGVCQSWDTVFDIADFQLELSGADWQIDDENYLTLDGKRYFLVEE